MVWEEVFTNASSQISLPGGRPWDGEAAEAAQYQAYDDRLTVIALADQLHNASAVARAGASEIGVARQRTIDAVRNAQSAGFEVGEDLSVTSEESGSPAQIAARRAQAELHAAEIRRCVTELVSTDQRVATQISTATADIGATNFPDLGEDTSAIRTVSNETIAEAPPQPVPPDPPPGPMPPVLGADDVKRALDPLQNGGKRGTNGVGKNPNVKEAWDPTSIKQMWDYLTRNATDGARPGYDGITRVLPDGTGIGLRQSAKGWNDTIDVWYPDGTSDKIHTPYAPYFPSIGEPPHLPPLADPVSGPTAPMPGHAPAALPPSGIFDPRGLPPWLQDPSTPGFHTPVQQPTIMPGVSLPNPPPSTITEPAGPGLLPDLGHDLAEVGKTAGAGVLAGIAIIGGFVVSGVSPGGQGVP